jgi:hypothetical protein
VLKGVQLGRAFTEALLQAAWVIPPPPGAPPARQRALAYAQALELGRAAIGQF